MLDREACAETQLSEREGDSCVPLHDVADTLKFSRGPRVSGEASGEQGLMVTFPLPDAGPRVSGEASGEQGLMVRYSENTDIARYSS